MALLSVMFYSGAFIAWFLVVFKFYLKLTSAWCLSQTCLVGKTALVTGANTGLGYETALDFAKRGAKVILACRNEEKARKACERIKEETSNPDVYYKLVDFSSLQSVQTLAQNINATEKRLDILVNNAATGYVPNQITKDGIEITVQVNYLSSFLLTILLLDLLKKTGSSRIVNVSSYAALFGDTNVEKMNEFRQNQYVKYATTKLYIILFTTELARKLEGTGVTTFSVHPGTAVTQIYRNVPDMVRKPLEFALNFLVKTPIEGAQTQIYCGVQKGIEPYSGEIFHECHAVNRYFNAKNRAVAENLWKKSEELINIEQFH
ncbi:retinol dehydrogenase 11-like [Cylas formicarius]|uniref:retinol dehydrogenase 11-like n=1 Tax=Cylas formicarius TaxID=197179 RepID=UPI002958ADDE|nr:retinol dehydrogenase 11-like [Cylas formicarius]